jgi:hypothetical protein
VFALPTDPPSAGGRKLKSLPEAAARGWPNEQQQARRLLQDATLPATAVMPAIQGGATGVGSRNPVLPTQLPPQTLEDMLCAIGPWAARPRNQTKCPKWPPGRYSFNGTTFKPVTIPVTFHCEWAAVGEVGEKGEREGVGEQCCSVNRCGTCSWVSHAIQAYMLHMNMGASSWIDSAS